MTQQAVSVTPSLDEVFKGDFRTPIGTLVYANSKPVAFYGQGIDWQAMIPYLQGRAYEIGAEVKITVHRYLDNPHSDVIIYDKTSDMSHFEKRGQS